VKESGRLHLRHHKELLLHVKLMRILQVENTCFLPVLHGKFYIEQEGQHPLTGQRAPPISGGT